MLRLKLPAFVYMLLGGVHAAAVRVERTVFIVPFRCVSPTTWRIYLTVFHLYIHASFNNMFDTADAWFTNQ